MYIYVCTVVPVYHWYCYSQHAGGAAEYGSATWTLGSEMADDRGASETGAAPAPATVTSSGWTFSAVLSPEDLASIQGLIAANFPRNGTTIAGPAAGGRVPSADEAAAADAAFEALVAANPDATVFRGPAGAGAPSVTNELGDISADDAVHAAEADAAFERMVAENPGAREVAPGVYKIADSEGRESTGP